MMYSDFKGIKNYSANKKKLEHTKNFIGEQLADIEAHDGANGNPVLIYIKQLKIKVAYLEKENLNKNRSIKYYKELNDAVNKNLVEKYGLHNFKHSKKETKDPIAEKSTSIADDLCCIFAEGAYEPSERGAGFSTHEGNQEEIQRIIYDLISDKKSKTK